MTCRCHLVADRCRVDDGTAAFVIGAGPWLGRLGRWSRSGSLGAFALPCLFVQTPRSGRCATLGHPTDFPSCRVRSPYTAT
eukprot:5541493-Pyramimonas_sp.AAC.1